MTGRSISASQKQHITAVKSPAVDITAITYSSYVFVNGIDRCLETKKEQ
jgi:hypothetical protein